MHSRLLPALGLVVSAMSLIVIGDAAGKLLTANGFSPFFVAWSRFTVGLVVLLPTFRVHRAELSQLLDWRIILRACLIVGGISLILTALRTEPIANVFGGFFVGPILAFVLSAVLLGERVTPARAVLLLIGFAGVLLVVKPGFGMTVGLGFAVAAGCFHGSFLVATRWLAGQYRSGFLMFSQLFIGAIVLLPLALTGWPAGIGWGDAGLILVSALGSAAGNYLLVVANKTTPASVVAPLVYSQLLAATVVGWIVFSDLPDALGLIGLGVITCSGLASLWLSGRAMARV